VPPLALAGSVDDGHHALAAYRPLPDEGHDRLGNILDRLEVLAYVLLT
jgi:hypothetical protein